jgi:NRPS condensation-like uncharacterized protein
MLSQESIAYPCIIILRMKIHGTLNRVIFLAAVDQMIDRHPLLRATITTRGGRSFWTIHDTTDRSVRWTNPQNPSNWPKPIVMDLHTQTGLQIDVEEYLDPLDYSQRALVFFQFHHAIADGLGITTAIHELWLLYDSLCLGRPVRLPELDPTALPKRNQFGLTRKTLLQLIPRQLVGLAGVRQYLMRKPVPLVPALRKRVAPNDHESSDSIVVPPSVNIVPSTPMKDIDSVSFEFSDDSFSRLKFTAKQMKVSLNDLIASCIFHGCSRFRKSNGFQSSNEWIRMMVPVNMRASREDQKQTACNIVSSIFLDRTPIQINATDALATSIQKEMDLIKKNRLAFMFIFSVWIRKMLTFRVNPHRFPKRCQTTIVFTNLGKLFSRSPLRDAQHRIVAGGQAASSGTSMECSVVIESFEGLAPLTPYMYAAFTTIQYAKKLILTMRYDGRVLSDSNAQQIIDATVSRLKQYASESLAS